MARWLHAQATYQQHMGSWFSFHLLLMHYFVCLQTTHQTAHGQLLDLTTSPPGSQDLSKFTINNYMRIVTFKTAYYSFYLPVACGMLLSGITKPEAFQTAKDILLVMGQYFQVLLMHICCAVCAHCPPHPYLVTH